MKEGERIANNYVLKHLLGKGGMGEVWLADEISLGRKVAIKFFTNPSWCEENPADRFLREAKVMALVSSPHIVTVHAISSEKKKVPYLIMEWVNGESLFSRLVREDMFEARTATHVAYQIALALQAAHLAGVVHRDLKPENVLLTSLAGDPWFVKVVDFGLARSYESEGSEVGGITTATVVLGTPAYMSPEQAMGKNLGPRSDLYSLGVLLYQMLSGKLPIEAETPHEFLVAHQISNPTPIQEQPGCEMLPEPLVVLIDKLLEKQLDARPPSSAAVARYLQAVDHEFQKASTGSFINNPDHASFDPAPTLAFETTSMGQLNPTIHLPSTEPLKFSTYHEETSLLSPKGMQMGQLVGRTEEMDQLLAHYDHVVNNGESRCVVVRGPSGAGVSRLMLQFLANLKVQSPKTLMMRLYPWAGLADIPGQPLSQLLLRAVNLDSSMSSSEIRKTFRTTLRKTSAPQLEGLQKIQQQQFRRAANALGHLVGATSPERPLEQNPTPKRLLSDIKTFGSRFLQSVFGKECVVVVIDHAERLGPTTLSLLESWLQRLQPGRWLFILGANEDAPAKSPLNRGNHVGAHVIRLEPLESEFMLRIGLAFSETSGLDASQLSQWIEDSEGLPGRLHARFLEKLLGMPLEEFLQTSDSFEAQILLLAAASGNSVTAGDIREIAGEDGVSVLRQWGRHGLLTPTQIHEFGEAGFAFDAGRYHRQLAKLRRKDIHQAYHEHLLNALRLRLSPDSLSLSPRILGHQVGVGDLDNSLRTATAIANHALTMGAFPEAIRCAKRVVQTLTKRADRRWLNNPEVQLFVQSVISLARSLAQTGNEQSAFQVFESAEQLLSQTPSPFVKIPLAQILVQHARLSTKPSNATKLYTKALDLLEPHDDPATHDHALLLSKILREVALLSLGDGNTALAKKLLVQAQDAADQTPEVTTKIDILRTRVELEKQRGKYNQAVELYREILKKAEEADDQPLVARTRMELGAMIGRMGKFEEGLENLNLAEQEFEDLEDPIRQTEVTLHKASILISRPDAWAARRLLESLTLDPILNPDLEARRLQLLAYVTVILQDVDQSNVYAKQSIELAQIVGDEQTELRAKLTLTHIMSRTPEQALRASRTLTEIVLKQKQIEDWEGLAHTYAYAARAAANGRIRGAGPTTAREMLKKAEKLYRQIGYLAEIRRLEDLQRRLGI